MVAPCICASRSAFPKSGWVSSLGRNSFIPSICTTKIIYDKYPDAFAFISPWICFTPRSVGASGETGDSVVFQGNAFHFQISLLSLFIFQIKNRSGNLPMFFLLSGRIILSFPATVFFCSAAPLPPPCWAPGNLY